jgi:hypothetical protein
MITIAVLILLWIIISVYKFFIEENENLFWMYGVMTGAIVIWLFLVYLVITYLP